MPRPPVLPTIDWKAIFDSGVEFSQWIQSAENTEHSAKMQDALDKLTLSPECEAMLSALSRAVHVIAIAEDWCGDVVRHVPVLERLAKSSANLKTQYITREQHPDVFARCLTNGGEAIPKFVFLSDNFIECGNWGPMPAQHRRLIARGKAAGDVSAARKRVSALYESDPNCNTVVDELCDLILTASCSRP